MNLAIAAAVFPVIFIGELPDKTMFASLVMASRGRPRAVWLGAAGAFLVHVLIATTIGAGLFAVLPRQAVDGVVAAMFFAGAVYAYVEGERDESRLIQREAASHRRVVTTAFIVIFIAEWGDLTQILTANLAAHYHDWLSVSVASLAALMAVAGLAVLSGSRILGRVPIRTLRLITAVILTGLAIYTLVVAL